MQKMRIGKNIVESCLKYKPVYLDEIVKAVSALGKVTGKKNQKFVSVALQIFEAVETRMENGECQFGACPIKDQCF